MGIVEKITWVYLVLIFVGLIVGAISLYNSKLSDLLVSFSHKVGDNIATIFGYSFAGIVAIFFGWAIIWGAIKRENPDLADSIRTVYCSIPLPDWVGSFLFISCN